MAKQAAFGTRLSVQYNQTGEYVDLINVGDISGPEVNAETIDVTTHDSPNRFAEFISGMADGGEVSYDLVFDAASAPHAALYNAVADRKLHNFYVKAPGFVSTAAGGYWSFVGLFTKMSLSFPVTDKIGASCNIKVSGKPVFHPFV